MGRARVLALLLAVGCSSPTTVVQPTPAPSPSAVSPTPSPSAVPDPTPAPSAVPDLALGGDVSWPQCPIGTRGALPKRQPKGLPFPKPEARFVVIGLTNGPGFYPNPCLAYQVEEAARRRLATAAYAFTTLPNAAQTEQYGGTGPYSTRTRLGRVQNAAYAQALINVRSMRTAGLRTPMVWIDIETQDYISPWGSDVVTNRAVVVASQRAYADSGYRTGLYSSDNVWRKITGGMRDSGPVWVTAGPRGQVAALAKCSAPTFSGGPALMAQWWDDTRDYDLLCPGAKGAELFALP